MAATVTISLSGPLTATSTEPCECCGELAATCQCDDGVCCWSKGASIDFKWTYDADIWNTKDVETVDCSGDGVNSIYMYHVHIEWTQTAVLNDARDGNGCCVFGAAGYYCRGDGGGAGCPPEYPDSPAPTPGLIVSIKDGNGNEVENIGPFYVGITFKPNCIPCVGWLVSASFNNITAPEALAGGTGSPVPCVTGDCTHVSDLTQTNPCHAGMMFVGDPNGWGSSNTAYVETQSVHVTAIHNECCRDPVTHVCKPGQGGSDGTCNPLP